MGAHLMDSQLTAQTLLSQSLPVRLFRARSTSQWQTTMAVMPYSPWKQLQLGGIMRRATGGCQSMYQLLALLRPMCPLA